ncbi:MAG TPA: hypothetical protein VD813_14200 [Pseudonocardia sp.]|nr:hypothetical protein [Pseudonocardia sp.]
MTTRVLRTAGGCCVRTSSRAARIGTRAATTAQLPADLPAIEAVPLRERGLPATTFALLPRAADLCGGRRAVTVLPEAARRREPVHRTFAELPAEVHIAVLFGATP